MKHFNTQQITYLQPKVKEFKRKKIILTADKLIKETKVYDFFRVLNAPLA